MKKFFVVIGALIIALSAYGIYDTHQKKQEAAEREKMTSVFYADVESIEKTNGKKTFTIVGTDKSEKKFVGKKYTFTEDKVENVLDSTGAKIKLSEIKENSPIVISHVGKIEKGDTNKLTGEVTLMPDYSANIETAPSEETDAETTEETNATEETNVAE